MPERPQAPVTPAKPAPAPAKPAAGPAKPATGRSAVAKPSGKAVEAAPSPPTSRLGWILGWIVAPAALVGVIYGGGVMLGAHRPDGWFARSVMWVAGLL